VSEALNFDAFGSVAEIMEATRAGKAINCGWIAPHERTAAQNKLDARVQAELPRFNIRGRFSASQRRYPLWMAPKILTGQFARYNWQTTGSCVGAGGDNALKTLMPVEILLKGDLEVLKDVWWLYAYGRSRFHGGMRGRGEGSFGSAWAEAVLKDGFFEDDGTGGKLPDFQVRDGWLVLPAKVELDWSDGAKIPQEYLTKGRAHPVKSMARMRSKDDCFEAIANGYPLTQASNFGFSGAKVKGSEFPIRVATWNGSWSHQTYVDEAWDHPELNGIYYRWGNNWGPDAHGEPTGDEPPGGVYIHESTLDQICKSGEVYAVSGAEGFPAQELSFEAF
jgi:hypothetical protein